jgi:aspartate racemase
LKTLGIIGGIGPDSTIAYYRLLTAAGREQGIEPPVLINSISMKRLLGLAGERKLDELTDYLAAEIGKLVNAGAAVALLAANTPHLVFDRLRDRVPIPLVSIVEAACEEAGERGFRRLALFGTRFTMQAPFYPEVFSRDRMLEIVRRLRCDESIDGVILGGTELPLLLQQECGDGIPLLDTSRIHVAYALRQLLAN